MGEQNNIHRLLGFAFASADLFLEIEDGARIAMALGAGQRIAGLSEAELAGRDWRDLILAADHPMVEALLASIGEAGRRGPVGVRMAGAGDPQRRIALSVCRFPPLETTAMAFALSLPEGASAGPGPFDAATFAAEAERLIARAAAGGMTLGISLVELSGLTVARMTIGPEEDAALQAKVLGALRAQAYGGSMVGQLGPESFAVVGPEGDTAQELSRRLMLTLAPALNALGDITAVVSPLNELGPGLDPERYVRALKYAMDSFAKDGAPKGCSVGEAFARSIRTTLNQAAAYRAMVAEHRFTLAFQPVVKLETGLLHHHEVLVRFGDGKSPFETIRMAEELDLIKRLDLAVLDDALKLLKGKKPPRLAVNVSGRSISDPAFVDQFRAAVRRAPSGASLIIEITESVAIEDFELVDAQIQRLRRDGHMVCLDDFGAGAASFAYLQRLRVDVIKIDGQYVRGLTDGRQASMMHHLVRLCHELGVMTVGEMIEGETVAEAARQAGIDFGQGYHYGRPTPQPEPLQAPVAVAVRRRGEVETWA